jgi:hypothetical protein
VGDTLRYKENIVRNSPYIFSVIVLISCPAVLCAQDSAPIPALPWLREGTILTYSKHAALVPGKPVTWKQNDEGDWIDPRTGKSYDKFINYGTSAPMIGQTRVLSIEGKTVALDSLTFTLEQNLGFADPVLLAPAPPEVTDVLSNSFWKSPALLAGEATDASVGKLVTHITWPMDGKNVDALRVQITNDQLYQLEIYDLKTGLCLHVASAWISGRDADTHITRVDLVRVGRLDIPWSGEPIPQAAIALDAMHFTGQIKNGGAFARLAPQPVTIDFTTKDKGQRWIRFDTSATISGLMAATPPFLYGPGEFGGLWIGPRAAAGLHEGQVLDDDPDTKMKTVVTKVTPRGIEITSSNQSCGRAYVYDLNSGLLTAWSEYDGPTQTSQMMQRK